ncbi:MAG: hypothetical protein ACYC6Y_19905, partial [Thermoguttaceae bacterium]
PLALSIQSPRADRHIQAAASPVAYVAAVLLTLLGAWTTGRLHRWPHLFGALLGLGWWLWLWPSAVGLLVVAVSVWTSLRSGWRRPRSSSSSIARLGVAGRP